MALCSVEKPRTILDQFFADYNYLNLRYFVQLCFDKQIVLELVESLV